MKAAIVPAICFVVGSVFGILVSKTGSTAEEKPREKRTSHSTLRSAIPGSSSQPHNASTPRHSKSQSKVSYKDLPNLNGEALQKAIEPLTADELLYLIKDSEKLEIPIGSIHWHQAKLLSRCAELDPDLAFEFANAISNRDQRSWWIDQVSAKVAMNDPTKALSIMASVSSPQLVERIARTLLKAGVSPDGVLAEMARQGIAPDDRTMLLVGEKIVADDPESALEILNSVSESDGVAPLLNLMLKELGASDPNRAVQLLETHRSGKGHRSQQINHLAAGWVSSDPAGARAWIESLEDPEDRVAALEAMKFQRGAYRSWLASQIEQLPTGESSARRLAEGFVEEWGTRNPKAALEWAINLPDGRARMGALHDHGIDNVIRKWTQDDLQAAIGWLESLDKSEEIPNRIAEKMLISWASVDRSTAAAYAETFGSSNSDQAWNRTPILSGIANDWARSDFATAHEWAGQLGDNEERAYVLRTMITESSEQAPTRAAGAFAQLVAEGVAEDQSHAYQKSSRKIGEAWSANDPAAAAQWSIELPDLAVDRVGVQQVAEQWFDTDPEVAAEWIAAAPEGLGRDAGVAALVAHLRSQDPESAFQWAQTIQDETLHFNSVREAVFRWRHSDSEAARVAVETADLPEALRKGMLSEIRQFAR